jgi:hypothetical protein
MLCCKKPPKTSIATTSMMLNRNERLSENGKLINLFMFNYLAVWCSLVVIQNCRCLNYSSKTEQEQAAELRRAGFCVDSWLRRLSATPLRFEPYRGVFPS